MRYCAFFHLRNKIDLLHLFMNKKDELLSASVKSIRHRRPGQKLQPGRGDDWLKSVGRQP
ncbi:hypothetical protein BN1007_40155 [Klebsiella variicola]|nr:hypothetical protein KVR801_80150 [Klebsiella variicola]CEP28652.1 hypothetical protein KV8917_160020 [Klebsiella variicola]CTQ04612.1 hypothetical protein BN1200_170021 [Klebsiella variicola]CTQ12346.1 hypothetical protein BN1007_40155 [Klebsiella variicola]CTQ13734.1 hypothetical protein BN1007_70158 [Klebsiella variicola]